MQVNKRTLADILGVSERTLTEWQSNGMPIEVNAGRGSSNEYDTIAVIQWMVERARVGAAKETAKDRLDRLRGDQLEREMLKEDDVLVMPEDLGVEYDALVEAVRAELLYNSPDALASELAAIYDVEIDVSIIRRHIEDALQKLSDYDPGDDDEPGETEPGDALPSEAECEALDS